VLLLLDSRGAALSCVERALTLGVRAFDSSATGLGGCPYAPGAPGNLATESLVRALHAAGWQTGIDADAVARAGAAVRATFGAGAIAG
jgi:hydroxymethylglutaryl-CoA lyase